MSDLIRYQWTMFWFLKKYFKDSYYYLLKDYSIVGPSYHGTDGMHPALRSSAGVEWRPPGSLGYPGGTSGKNRLYYMM